MSITLVSIGLESGGLKPHVQVKNVDTPLRALQVPLWQIQIKEFWVVTYDT